MLNLCNNSSNNNNRISCKFYLDLTFKCCKEKGDKNFMFIGKYSSLALQKLGRIEIF